MIHQCERNQIDREMIIRAEALIAGYRYARGQKKLSFRRTEEVKPAKKPLKKLTEIEQMILDVCKMCDE